MKGLQERAQSSSEARVREAEAKNRLLHQSVTDAGSRLASLETQLKVVSKEAECLRERAGRCEEAQREAARLERSREALTREVGTRICAGSWSGCNQLIPVLPPGGDAALLQPARGGPGEAGDLPAAGGAPPEAGG